MWVGRDMSIISAERWARHDATDASGRRVGWREGWDSSGIRSRHGRPLCDVDMLGCAGTIGLRSHRNETCRVREVDGGQEFETSSRSKFSVVRRDSLTFPDGTVCAPDGGILSTLLEVDRPGENIWQFDLGLPPGTKAAYQPPLTWREWWQGCQRPSWAVGSYALFYDGMKVGHIARPFAYDQHGNWVWCKLTIQNGVATIEVPQRWAAARRGTWWIDPDIGYTTAGASSVTLTGGNLVSFAAAGGCGVATGMKAYVLGNGAHSMTLGFYDATGALLRDTGGGNCATGSAAWVTQTLDSNYTLTNGVAVSPAENNGATGGNTIAFYYDTDSNSPAGHRVYAASAYSAGALPNPAPALTLVAAEFRRWSIYIVASDPVFPAAANVWYGSGAYGAASELTPTKRASSITNCSAANIRYGVAVDDVTGGIEMPNTASPTGTQDATSDACVVSGKKYGSPQRTGSASSGGGTCGIIGG